MNKKSKSLSPAEIACDFGKVPPQALDLEAAVLGAAMLEGGAVDELSSVLTPGAFYKDAHRVIYEAICRLSKAGNPVDIYTVVQELRSAGELENIGGAQYISSLTLKVGSAANIGYHAKIIAQKHLQRELIRISSDALRSAFDDSADVEDLLDGVQQDMLALAEGNAGREAAHVGSLAARSVAGAKRRAESAQRGEVIGVSTGLVDLDKRVSGWQPSDLIVLAGRPSMGKTAMMLHLAKSAAKSGTPAAIFSLEMSGVQLTDRLVLSESENVNADHFRSGYSSQEELRALDAAAGRVSVLPIHVDDTGGVSMAQIRARARMLHRQGKCGILFIDYLQLCREKGDWGNNRVNEVSLQSATAKAIAKELNIPVVLLSQLSRDVEKRGGDRRPQMSDLRDSGGIEQDADVVAFVYRPAYYFKEAADEQGKPYGDSYGELIVAKNRNGRTGTVPWRHNESLTKIYDDGDTPPPQSYYEPFGGIEANVEF